MCGVAEGLLVVDCAAFRALGAPISRTICSIMVRRKRFKVQPFKFSQKRPATRIAFPGGRNDAL